MTTRICMTHIYIYIYIYIGLMVLVKYAYMQYVTIVYKSTAIFNYRWNFTTPVAVVISVQHLLHMQLVRNVVFK